MTTCAIQLPKGYFAGQTGDQYIECHHRYSEGTPLLLDLKTMSMFKGQGFAVDGSKIAYQFEAQVVTGNQVVFRQVSEGALIALTPDSVVVSNLGDDWKWTIRVWKADGQVTFLPRLRKVKRVVGAFADHIVVLSGNNLNVFDRRGELTRTLCQMPGATAAGRVHMHKHQVMALIGDELQWHDLATGVCRVVANTESHQLQSVVGAPHLAVTQNKGQVTVWSMVEGQQHTLFEQPGANHPYMSFSKVGDYLVGIHLDYVDVYSAGGEYVVSHHAPKGWTIDNMVQTGDLCTWVFTSDANPTGGQVVQTSPLSDLDGRSRAVSDQTQA